MSGPLGVIGGMGPFASAYFYKRLTQLQSTENEQDYIDILLYSKPSIPDRTKFILGKSPEDPLAAMLEAGRVLENAGVKCIAIPCCTAHFFYKRLTENLRVPVLNIVKETAARLTEAGVTKAGLMATDGTVKARVFQEEFTQSGIETVNLEEKSQESLMEFIYKSAKRGVKPDTGLLKKLSGELFDAGAEKVILGCTELSLAGTDWQSERHVDALELLAKAALDYMLKD